MQISHEERMVVLLLQASSCGAREAGPVGWQRGCGGERAAGMAAPYPAPNHHTGAAPVWPWP